MRLILKLIAAPFIVLLTILVKQTHRDMLRRDVEEALAKCGSFREIEYYLKCLGYRFQRDFHYAHPSVIIDGWQRPIRIDSLGPQFSRETIRERCLENQLKPELYGYAYPQRKRAPLLRKTRRSR